jgi:hypothetical protein
LVAEPRLVGHVSALPLLLYVRVPALVVTDVAPDPVTVALATTELQVNFPISAPLLVVTVNTCAGEATSANPSTFVAPEAHPNVETAACAADAPIAVRADTATRKPLSCRVFSPIARFHCSAPERCSFAAPGIAAASIRNSRPATDGDSRGYPGAFVCFSMGRGVFLAANDLRPIYARTSSSPLSPACRAGCVSRPLPGLTLIIFARVVAVLT